MITATELIEKFKTILGSNCEHDGYCKQPKCNINGETFCHVDINTAIKCAVLACELILKEYDDLNLDSVNKDMHLSEVEQVFNDVKMCEMLSNFVS